MRALVLGATMVVAGCGGSTGTIGAWLGQRPDGRLFVRAVPRGLAASAGGVREGDEILLVDGRDVRQMNERDLHRALEGDIGDPVKLTLVRGNDIVRVTLRLTPSIRTPGPSLTPEGAR